MKRKHFRRVLYKWLVVVGVTLVIGGSGLLLLQSDNTQPKAARSLAVRTDVDQLIVDIESEVVGMFGADYETRRTGWDGQRDAGDARSVSGYDFALSSRANAGIVIEPHAAGDALRDPGVPAEQIVELVRQKLVNGGFQENRGGATSYNRGDTVCSLSLETVDWLEGYNERHNAGIITLSCEGTVIDRAFAAQADEFVAAYRQAHKKLKEKDIVYGPMVVRSQDPSGPIGASKAAGYDLAEAVVAHSGNSSIALFYNKQGGDWHFIAEATDEFGFSCKDIMKDRDARKAYGGYWCQDNGLRILDYDAARDSCGQLACGEDGKQQ